MIKIIKSKDIEKNWFNGREFEETNETVQNVISDVIENGDSALQKYSKMFDVSSPKTFEISEHELKAAADKLKAENPDMYHAISYSHELALKFATRQRQSFDNFEVELTPGVFTGQKNIPVEGAGVYVPAGRFPLLSTVVMTVTPVANLPIASRNKRSSICKSPVSSKYISMLE